jgi:5-methylcytosine-specific restriction endonuclease McrA
MATRTRTGGSLYQRADGQWIGTIELGRNENGTRVRKIVSSTDRATAEARLRELNPNYGIKPRTRTEMMREARKLGTHTGKEWGAKVAATKTCRYCDTDLNMFNMVQDHILAIESGGSDAIDNLQPICWECNVDKYITPADQYTYTGEKPRPFSVFPNRRKMYDRMMEAKKKALSA